MMIEWASSDVDKLLLLAAAQDKDLTRRGLDVNQAKKLSTKNSTYACDMKLERGLRCSIPIGRFIGTRGSNLRSLQNRTGTLVYQEFQAPGERAKWMVYYKDEVDLASVRLAML
jgi:hypothetical protein